MYYCDYYIREYPNIIENYSNDIFFNKVNECLNSKINENSYCSSNNNNINNSNNVNSELLLEKNPPDIYKFLNFLIKKIKINT